MKSSDDFTTPNAPRSTGRLLLRVAVAVVLGLALCACSEAPTHEQQPPRPESTPQPPPVSPELPTVAAPANETVRETPEKVTTEVSEPIIADRDNSIFFPPGSATIDDDGKEKLQECADLLKQHPKKHILITGYSDDLGSKNYSLAISEQRITAVTAALRSLGVERGKIRRNRSNSVKTTASACRSDKCRQQMRRVELVCGA